MDRDDHQVGQLQTVASSTIAYPTAYAAPDLGQRAALQRNFTTGTTVVTDPAAAPGHVQTNGSASPRKPIR